LFYNVKSDSFSITARRTDQSQIRRVKATNPEEVLGRSGVDGAVLDFGLFREVVGGVDGRQHTLDGEKGGEVGGVGRNDDKCKEPPGAADDSPC